MFIELKTLSCLLISISGQFCVLYACVQNALRLMAFHQVHCVLGMASPAAAAASAQQPRKRPYAYDSGL